MPILNLIQAVNQALVQEMETDERVVVLGEDVGLNGGVFRATEGLYEKFGPERVIDTPLSELGIVGVSIGMALYGLRPVAELQFDGFMPPALDQIISHASRLRNRSRGRFNAPIVIRAPYGAGIKALEHHSDSPEATYAHIPGLKVVIPSTPYDTKGLLIASIRDPDPVIFLEPKRIYRAVKGEVPKESYAIPLGEARVVREGGDVTLIGWGAMMRVALEVAEKAGEEKIDVEVIDVRTISPLDVATLVSSAKKTGRVVIVHEAPRNCGVGAEIAALISERAFLNLEAPMERVTGYDVIAPLAKLEDYNIPNAARVLKAVERAAKF